MSADVKGDAYEGLLEKNAREKRGLRVAHSVGMYWACTTWRFNRRDGPV